MLVLGLFMAGVLSICRGSILGSVRDRFGVRPGPVWGRSGSICGRSRTDWVKAGVDLTPVCGRLRTVLESDAGRFGNGLGPLWGRSGST